MCLACIPCSILLAILVILCLFLIHKSITAFDTVEGFYNLLVVPMLNNSLRRTN